MSHITQQEVQRGLDHVWTKEEELAEVSAYIARLYEDLDDPEYQ